MNKKGKVLGHLPRLNSSNAGSLKLLSEVKQSSIVIKLCPKQHKGKVTATIEECAKFEGPNCE